MSKELYNDYIEKQIERSNLKWASSTFYKYGYRNFKTMINEILDVIEAPKNICCLGIRYKNEYEAFQEFGELKNSIVYGIDINPRVVEIGENCYCYDFTHLPEEWENKFDLVYSNSLDHAYNIKETLDEWHRISNKYLFLTLANHKVTEVDLHSFTEKDVDKLIGDKFRLIKKWNMGNVSILIEIVK